MEVINCSAVAEKYERRLAGIFVSNRPTLATILSSSDEWSKKYQTFLEHDCKRLGVSPISLFCRSDGDLLQRVRECNDNPDVQGILVFYPLGGNISLDRYVVANNVSPQKDVEGLNRYHIGGLVQKYDENSIIPATARAVIEVLKYHNFAFQGTGVILNRSDIVGKPLRIALENLGMTVLAAYEQTDKTTLESLIPRADLVVTAVPDASYRLSSGLVKPGSVVIAVNPSNVAEEELQHCKLVTSKSNPIGRVTRKITLLNLYHCIQMSKTRID